MRVFRLCRLVGYVALVSLAMHRPTMALERGTLPRESLRCVIPTAPGGGFDITCDLLVTSLAALAPNLPIVSREYKVGGLGRRAFVEAAASTGACSGTVVAVSGGTLLNLAQGKFGRLTASDVRWLGAVAVDFGVFVVRDDSPWRALGDLLQAQKKASGSIRFGGAGDAGSQDWTKTRLLWRAFEQPASALHYQAYEGGGELLSGLERGDIDVAAGDLSETLKRIAGGSALRIIAVLSQKHASGPASELKTAREQGFDLQWPVIRGFYACASMQQSAYLWWLDQLQKMQNLPAFEQARAAVGLRPFALFGADFERFVMRRVDAYRQLADELREPL